MNSSTKQLLSINDVCDSTQISSKLIVKIVEHGIIDQDEIEPDSWKFESDMIPTINKALRLHRDLKLNWSGVALALSLINEVESLRVENKRLYQRLHRYSDEI